MRNKQHGFVMPHFIKSQGAGVFLPEARYIQAASGNYFNRTRPIDVNPSQLILSAWVKPQTTSPGTIIGEHGGATKAFQLFHNNWNGTNPTDRILTLHLENNLSGSEAFSSVGNNVHGLAITDWYCFIVRFLAGTPMRGWIYICPLGGSWVGGEIGPYTTDHTAWNMSNNGTIGGVEFALNGNFYWSNPYLSIATHDLTNAAIRDKFAKNGLPVYLGDSGELPSGGTAARHYYPNGDMNGVNLGSEATVWTQQGTVAQVTGPGS